MGLITRQELADNLRKELDDVKSYIEGSNNAEMGAHMLNLSNPHKVTKAQVGLGNVDNAKQATKTEFDTHVANKSNPHGVTASQVGAPPTSRTISAGNGLTGGGSLSANRTLSVDLSYFNTRFLGIKARATDAEKLGGYKPADFMRHGEKRLRMANNDGFEFDDSGNEMYFVFDDKNYRAYHSKNITYGTKDPSGGKNGDIYIQY